MQSALRPNPVAGYSVENVFGSHNWHGWESAESRYEIAQLIELGGKRNFRISVAKSQFYAALAEYETSRLNLFNQLMKQFITVAAFQELLKVTEEQKKIAAEVLKSISDKVEAGRVSLIQQNKADIALSNAEINLQKAILDLQSAKEKLALFWVYPFLDFSEVFYPFFELQNPQEIASSQNALPLHPESVQCHFQLLAAYENLKLEKSNAVPDVTLSLGYKTLQDTGDKGLMLGASMPIPFFNRNQGAIYQAKAEISRADEQCYELQQILQTKLSISHRELLRAYQEALRIQTHLLKSAEESFEMAKEGYFAGKFEYLEMLDAQRTLFEIRERHIQSLLNYHLKLADIQFLTSKIE